MGDTASATPISLPAMSHWSSFGKNVERVLNQTSAWSGDSWVGTAGSAILGQERNGHVLCWHNPASLSMASVLTRPGQVFPWEFSGQAEAPLDLPPSDMAPRPSPCPGPSTAPRDVMFLESLPCLARTHLGQCPEMVSLIPRRGCIRLCPEQDVVGERAVPSS